MALIVKAVVIGISGGVLTLIIKRTNPELSVLLTLTVCSFIVGMALKVFSEITEVFSLIELSAGFSSAYTAPILKCVGIGITARIGSDICKDSGQDAVASGVEICGAVCALYVSLPLIKTMLRMIGGLA
ncbi:MAG: stage III sporulation AC/AD family protein [Oscillospiraceae bacterium]|jgi:stage III sporulation protein AD|nr:stage III sporulation AC/AD family protein [Oscillospiraceae bacterium]